VVGIAARPTQIVTGFANEQPNGGRRRIVRVSNTKRRIAGDMVVQRKGLAQRQGSSGFRIDVPYLDLTPAMRAEQDAAERFYLLQRHHGVLTGNEHMSREAYAVAARALVDWLIANELVPP
jgi:hypothetical protein